MLKLKTTTQKSILNLCFITFLIFITSTISNASDYKKSVVIIVSENVYTGIVSGLNTFIDDLRNENYNVILKNSNMNSPEEVRTYLQGIYNLTSPKLIGAILIGNIPYAYQFFTSTSTNPNIPPTSYNTISFQFYSDLNGVFGKTNPIYPNSYSSHTGDIYSEIWISVLPMYQNDQTLTTSKLNKYFQKNHIYRTGGYQLQNGFINSDELYNATTQEQYTNYIQILKNSDYSWQPLSSWGNCAFFINNNLGFPTPYYAYFNALKDSKYKIAVLDAHGTTTTNGDLSYIDVRQSITIKPVFIWLGGCFTGNLEDQNNIATETAYSDLSKALVVKGGTCGVGGLGNNTNGFYGHNIAVGLLQGKSFGESVLAHLQTPLIYPWSDDFDMYNAPNIFIGDLSLTLFPGSTIKLPSKSMLQSPGTNLINQPKNITVKWSYIKDAEKYFIQISQDQVFSTIVKTDSTTSDTMKTLTGLVEGQKYFWRVQSKNIIGSSSWSDVWNFTTSLSTPTYLRLKGSAAKEVTLIWVDNSTNQDGFLIERKQSSQMIYSLLDTVKGSLSTYIDKNIQPGVTYTYRIKAYTKYAESGYSNEVSINIVGVEEGKLPVEYSMSQNYPNPFNPTTKIKFSLPEAAFTKLIIYDVIGRNVKTLINHEISAGNHEVDFNAQEFSGGVYFYKIQTNKFTDIKKMLFIK